WTVPSTVGGDVGFVVVAGTVIGCRAPSGVHRVSLRAPNHTGPSQEIDRSTPLISAQGVGRGFPGYGPWSVRSHARWAGLAPGPLAPAVAVPSQPGILVRRGLGGGVGRRH